MTPEEVYFAIIVVLIILIFSQQIIYLVSVVKRAVLDMIEGPGGKKLPCGCLSVCKCNVPDESDHNALGMQRREKATNKEGEGESSILDELGYGDGASWEDTLKATAVDPSVIENHSAFVADVRRFSSGANFTAVNDEDGNMAYTNFRGLQRPQHVHIGESARSQPDVDPTVLQRNNSLRWGYKSSDYPL